MKSSRPSWQVSQFPRDGRDQDPNRDLAKRVPLEYSIGWVACTVANMMNAVMVGLPGAAQDRLPASAATGNVCPVLPKPMQVVSRRLGLPRGDAAAGGDGAVREGTQNRRSRDAVDGCPTLVTSSRIGGLSSARAGTLAL